MFKGKLKFFLVKKNRYILLFNFGVGLVVSSSVSEKVKEDSDMI